MELALIIVLVVALVLMGRTIWFSLDDREGGRDRRTPLGRTPETSKIEKTLLVIQSEKEGVERDLKRLNDIHTRDSLEWDKFREEERERRIRMEKEIRSLRQYSIELSKGVTSIFTFLSEEYPEIDLKRLPKLPKPPETLLEEDEA